MKKILAVIDNSTSKDHGFYLTSLCSPQQSHAEISELSQGLQHLGLEGNRLKDVHAIQSDTVATHASVLSKAKRS